MKKYLLIAVLAIIGIALYGVAKFYIWKTMDYWQRPWAYSRDANTPLLIGKWQGTFKDPDLVDKQITLEIRVPETDSLRWTKAYDIDKVHDRSANKNARFEGTAAVSSKLGTEYYEVSGLVKDGHRFQLFFTFDQDKKKVLPNFALSTTNEDSNWDGDEMNFKTTFSYYKADGVLLYKSGDPQHRKEVAVRLRRLKI